MRLRFDQCQQPGAVVQYVGQTALFSGTKAERKRAKDSLVQCTGDIFSFELV